MIIKKTIALVEDDVLYAESFTELVKTFEDYEFVGHVTSVEEVIDKQKPIHADIYVIDHELPGINGIDGIPYVKAKFPDAKVIVFTIFDEEDKLFLALSYGASGYILKNDDEERILKALNEVRAGGMLFSPAMAQKVLKFFSRRKSVDISITKREKEVLQKMKKGLSKKEIAGELIVSYNTIDTHIKNIYKKLQVNDKTKAVIKAIENDLI